MLKPAFGPEIYFSFNRSTVKPCSLFRSQDYLGRHFGGTGDWGPLEPGTGDTERLKEYPDEQLSNPLVQACRNHVLLYEYILLLQVSSCICNVGLSEPKRRPKRYTDLTLI